MHAVELIGQLSTASNESDGWAACVGLPSGGAVASRWWRRGFESQSTWSLRLHLTHQLQYPLLHLHVLTQVYIIIIIISNRVQFSVCCCLQHLIIVQQHYMSCSSVRPSVRLSVPYGLLTRKPKSAEKKQNWSEHSQGRRTGVLIFSSKKVKGQKDGRIIRRHWADTEFEFDSAWLQQPIETAAHPLSQQ